MATRMDSDDGSDLQQQKVEIEVLNGQCLVVLSKIYNAMGVLGIYDNDMTIIKDDTEYKVSWLKVTMYKYGNFIYL